MILFFLYLPRSVVLRLRWVLVATIFACIQTLVLFADTSSDTVRRVSVPYIKDKITIDGVLDESIWKSAPKIGDLIQREPDTGQPVSEKTEITLLRDEDNLYVGVVAYDSEPDKIIGTTMERDPSLRSEDRVSILLDTFQDQRNAFYFATNPAGALLDGLAFGNQDLNTNWDAIWDVQTKRTDQGWTAEFAIPFKSLNFPEDQETWGFNIIRSIYRKPEESVWSGASLESTFLKVSGAGEITNMQGINQGIGLDVRPFVAASWLDTKETGDFDFEPGLDIFYNITPSLKLTGTINTDFGETEVDTRQINLDRFSLFFPEKRSFFLEDVGVFNFASVGPEGSPGTPDARADVFPFFSRRIGLLEGQEVPIDVGAKLTGKVGSTEIGILGVRTGETAFAEDKNFFVGRVKQNFWEQSYVGGIFTSGNPAPGETSKTFTVPVLADSTDENNETAILTLSNASNASISDATGTLAITDDDVPPTVNFSSTSSSGAESVSSKALTVELSAASGQDVTVAYAFTGTAGASGVDHSAVNGTLTIAAGDTSGTITIPSIVNDALDEPDETVTVTLSNPSNATLGTDKSHTYTIIDNDAAPSLSINDVTTANENAANATFLNSSVRCSGHTR